MRARDGQVDNLYHKALCAMLKSASRVSVYPLAPHEPFNRSVSKRRLFDAIKVTHDTIPPTGSSL